MARIYIILSLLIVNALAAGCSQERGTAVSTGPEGAASQTSPSDANSTVGEGLAHAGTQVNLLPAPTASPRDVVQAFLDASRGGREELAAELLSSKAREATSSQGLALDPPGPSSMVYRLGEVEYPTQDRQAAYVTSVWQEEGPTKGDSGDSYQVTWILRQQAEGWRIAGMASKANDEAEPVLINFEDVEDLHKIKPDVGGEPQVE